MRNKYNPIVAYIIHILKPIKKYSDFMHEYEFHVKIRHKNNLIWSELRRRFALDM